MLAFNIFFKCLKTDDLHPLRALQKRKTGGADSVNSAVLVVPLLMSMGLLPKAGVRHET